MWFSERTMIILKCLTLPSKILDAHSKTFCVRPVCWSESGSWKQQQISQIHQQLVKQPTRLSMVQSFFPSSNYSIIMMHTMQNYFRSQVPIPGTSKLLWNLYSAMVYRSLLNSYWQSNFGRIQLQGQIQIRVLDTETTGWRTELDYFTALHTANREKNVYLLINLLHLQCNFLTTNLNWRPKWFSHK